MTTSGDSATDGVRRVEHAGGALHAVERPGHAPAVVLLHGFPDDHAIYDRLMPLLAPNHVVAFDWLGYGRSDRPEPRAFARSDRQHDLAAVVESLRLDEVALVAHDAAGPEAIEWTLEYPSRVKHLILLNTYYGHSEHLLLPEWVRMLADPDLAPLGNAMLADEQVRMWLLGYTANRFGLQVGDPEGLASTAIAPQFIGGAAGQDALTEIRAWTGDLYPALDEQDERIRSGRLASLNTPVTIIFGANDPFLSPRLAAHLSSLFPAAELRIVDDAGHWPQWDQPQAVAEIVRAALERERQAR